MRLALEGRFGIAIEHIERGLARELGLARAEGGPGQPEGGGEPRGLVSDGGLEVRHGLGGAMEFEQRLAHHLADGGVVRRAGDGLGGQRVSGGPIVRLGQPVGGGQRVGGVVAGDVRGARHRGDGVDVVAERAEQLGGVEQRALIRE